MTNQPAVLLVNPNKMMPPIAPLGLEYLAASLAERGFEPALCDLTWHDDWPAAIQTAIRDTAPFAVGVSIRNIDDAYFASQDFVLDHTAAVIRKIRELSDALVILGGVGFSAAPAEILAYTGAGYGIAGEGEDSFPALLNALRKNLRAAALASVAGAVYRAEDGTVAVNTPKPVNLAHLPPASRRFADNVRYFNEGGQAGLETLRGCPHTCVYCIDPLAKGRTTRVRPAVSVVGEVCALLDQGIDVLHLCDCEFNLDVDHCWSVCETLISRHLPSRVKWYTYAAPTPFNDDLALELARGGCAGINFGVDHADPAMLRRLGRTHTPDDVRALVKSCRAAGIAVMLDMLLGGPGETLESVAHALDFMREVAPDRAGLSVGVRIYPHTRLATIVRSQGPIESNPNLHGTVKDNPDFLKPIFYIDEKAGPDLHQYVTRLVAGEKMFFHADPAQIDGNYNYNNNSVLATAIRNGARGAYWDILAKLT
ncbi:MAG: radical SAM protein [Candidatus Hydrogenedentes bacterium]|nr:radical SAM protein [Candidatus Hydrogenedentota bacterium]